MDRFLRYLKAAFWVRERIPLLGDIPVNFLAVVAFVALGFGHPAFWLLGLTGETAFLWTMAGSKRFRHLVDAEARFADRASQNSSREILLSRLSPAHRARFDILMDKLEHVSTFYNEFAPADLIGNENLANLRTLENVYLQLLIARQHLSSTNSGSNEEKIRQQISRLESQLGDFASSRSAAARESMEATVGLLRKRLAVFAKRDEAVGEIDADLIRIETQFDLAADSAAIRAQPAEAKLDLDIASRMISTPEYLDLGRVSDVTGEPIGLMWEKE